MVVATKANGSDSDQLLMARNSMKLAENLVVVLHLMVGTHSLRGASSARKSQRLSVVAKVQVANEPSCVAALSARIVRFRHQANTPI